MISGVLVLLDWGPYTLHVDWWLCLSSDISAATDKVALLVGNNHYQNHPNLMAPITDVFELSLLLKKLGFRVVSLLDLNKVEMMIAVNQFLQLLGKGVYGKLQPENLHKGSFPFSRGKKGSHPALQTAWQLAMVGISGEAGISMKRFRNTFTLNK